MSTTMLLSNCVERINDKMKCHISDIDNVMTQVKRLFDNREGGLQNVVFVACGGSLASSYPARYLLNAESRRLRILGYNSDEFIHATPKIVGPNTLVIGTSTKATTETVDALKKARSLEAITIALTGYADSLTATTANYYLTYYHKDEWYKDSSLIHCNSQGTALKIAFWLLKEYDQYAHYQKALRAFEKLTEIYPDAYDRARMESVAFAMRYRNDDIWNVLGSGVTWEAVYSDSFSFFQEMQTLHSVPIHSGEYFHGAFETTDENLAILLLKSTGRTRNLDERVERFLKRFGGHHYVMDAEDYGISALDPSVAEYFNALLLHPLSKQFIAALGDIRMHPMSYRRYMWKFDY